MEKNGEFLPEPVSFIGFARGNNCQLKEVMRSSKRGEAAAEAAAGWRTPCPGERVAQVGRSARLESPEQGWGLGFPAGLGSGPGWGRDCCRDGCE